MRSKSAEISADRLGLLACGDLEPAICAMLKTLSGLGGDHINLDIPAFLNELRSVSEIRTLDAEIWNTHPPLPLRVKALLWFSMGKTFASYTDGDVAGKMEKNALDQKVFNDMKSQLGDFTQQQFDQAEEEVQLWLSAVAVCRDGRLDKSEQQKLNTDLGLEATQKLISFLSMHSAEEIDAVLLEKLNSACENYQHLAPTRSRQVIPELINEVSSRFQQSDLRQFIRDKSHLLSEISVNIISSG
ncbi:hypothetical protein JCM14722_09480 [Pseudodesulfovibrio portus]|uniref:Peptidase M48 Ste24p n=2 Tax=Pseudodesulfovibrio portus TaxID=231439 RepID=A0ABN6RUC1_9BACT|nr:hypothetical protein JCM14722_09480 [Pseudodesulfovibrio portus]